MTSTAARGYSRVRRTVGAAVAVDTGAFAPLRGLRAAVGVALVLAVGVALGQSAAGVLAAVGALTAGTVSLTQGSRAPLATMGTAGAALATSTFVGCVTARTLPAELLALALWGAAAGLLAGAGQAATTVGVQAVVGLVVTGRFPLTPGQALRSAAEVLLGAAVQVLLAALVRPPERDRAERREMARLATALAGWARSSGRRDATGTADLIEATRVLFDKRAGWSQAAPLRSLLTGLARARLEISVLTLAHDRAHPAERDAARDVLAAAAVDLDALAAQLRRDRTPGLHPSAGGGADRTGDDALAPLLDVDRPDDAVAHRARALAGQLRAAQLSFTAWERARPRAAEVLRTARTLSARPIPRGVVAALRHPSQAAGRHAVRLAVLLPAAEIVGRHLPGSRGYWVALTAIVVLKPDFATSVTRGIGRIIGTLAGVVPVSLAVGSAHPQGPVLILGVGVLAWAAYTTFPAGFALYSGCLAGLVVVLLDVVDPGGPSIAGTRALDTAVGGVLALLGYLALPSWEGPRLPEAVARLVEAEDSYVGKVIRAYGVTPAGREELGATARAVRLARAGLEASLGRAEAEPRLLAGSDGALRVRVARDALAATSRVVASVHVLHARVVDRAEGPHGTHPGAVVSPADAEAVAAALHDVLADTARAVRTQTPLGSTRDLRAAAAVLVDTAPDAGIGRRTLGREVDELVDAVDTLRFALADRPSPVTGG